jgi:hypothetical protein
MANANSTASLLSTLTAEAIALWQAALAAEHSAALARRAEADHA